ncbi:hypothetical protein ACFLR1_03585 [Bacteroidota bacterium]
MKKVAMILVAMVTLGLTNAMAQDKTEGADSTALSTQERAGLEAEFIKLGIERFSQKLEANESTVNPVEAQKRLAEMKAKWEALTGEVWVESEDK